MKLLAFVTTTWLLAMLPGVGQAIMLRQVLVRGRRAPVLGRVTTLEGVENPFAEVSDQLTRLYAQKDATGRWFRFSPSDNELIPWSTLMYAQGAALLGNKAFGVSYTDTATLQWVYSIRNTGTELFRCLVI